nr:kinesin-like protein KIN12B isoform X2 [Tanacetum cinerariifolium]
MRPVSRNEEGGTIVEKTSGDTLSIQGQNFTFDSVADETSTQMDIFELVGAPLVENCLAGFNSSIFAYGQSGSGKTYTIWGPTNALFEDKLSSNEKGLTPRVFERLFSRISEEQIKQADKQLVYQCHCSFLEIYNEQITDLLNPTQRNLHLREDTKTGVYVENLTEEPISNMKDVKEILKKGLSNRRTGATSLNIESSRSHSVFTCVVESRLKSTDGLSCCKTSRMNLVDLAGSERQTSTGAAGQRLKEAGNINRSLSQLGNLINILAEVSQTGKQRHIPYRDSKLTFLLQESLGGNAKLSMICAISPAQSCKSETVSTIRFAQRAKAIKNKAVVNEQMQNDVNTLREVIKQLKDELIRIKSTGNQVDPSAGYSTGWNARRSINVLKYSLHHPLILPHVDDDGDEEMEIVDETEQATVPSNEDNKSTTPIERKDSADSDVTMEEVVSEQDRNIEVAGVRNPETNGDNQDTLSLPHNGDNQDSLDPSEVSPILKSPTPSVSPLPINTSRKSLRTSSMLTASQKELTQTTGSEPSKNINFNPQSAHLAASLHGGLEVIKKNQKGFAFPRSSLRFSYKPSESKPLFVKKDVGVQARLQGNEIEEQKPVMFLCRNCKCTSSQDVKDGNDGQNLQLVPVDDKPKQLVPKAVEKVLTGAIRREMALEEICSRQDSEINQLNHLLRQYKHERECNMIIGQIREDKIARLESLMDGILSAEEFKDEELTSLKNENMLLKENYENQPEVLRTEIEFKRFQDELERYQNFFDLGERDVLLEEIQDLRNQLQLYMDSSSKSSHKKNHILKITYPSNPSVAPPLSTVQESVIESAEQRFEMERARWNEAESKWISLTEDLERELEASRLLVEKQKNELDTERKCSKELKDAMEMAMEGHARMLEQYADLEEKHINLLTSQRRIEDGIVDVKKAAAKAGVKSAESKFINALAAEISTLKEEREKERLHYRDENKGLQAQLRDTAEAVQAAGELLVRLKEAEEAVAAAEAHTRKLEQAENVYKEKFCKKRVENGHIGFSPIERPNISARAREAEQEKEKAYKEIESLKRKQENVASPPLYDIAMYDDDKVPNTTSDDPQWRNEFENFYNENEGELTNLP